MIGRDGFDDDRAQLDGADQIRDAFDRAIDRDAIEALDDATVEKLIAILDHAEDRRER